MKSFYNIDRIVENEKSGLLKCCFYPHLPLHPTVPGLSLIVEYSLARVRWRGGVAGEMSHVVVCIW